jgi:hypothetical protein
MEMSIGDADQVTLFRCHCRSCTQQLKSIALATNTIASPWKGVFGKAIIP